MRRLPLSHGLRVADSLCSSTRRSGSGRGPQNVPPLQKSYKRWLLLEMVGPRPWTFGGFFWGGFRFLEPLAPSNQQQHGSQRLCTRPQSLLTGVSGILENFASESCTMAEVVAQ